MHYKDDDSAVNAEGLQVDSSHTFCTFEFPKKRETVAKKSHIVQVFEPASTQCGMYADQKKSTDYATKAEGPF